MTIRCIVFGRKVRKSVFRHWVLKLCVKNGDKKITKF